VIRGKTKKEIELMKIAGNRLASIFKQVGDVVRVGVTTAHIDLFIAEKIKEAGLFAECKGYRGYPAVSCISVNDVIVHGIPSDQLVLSDGDFVKVDVVASYKGYCADMARGFFVGTPNPEAVAMQEVAEKSFEQAVAMLKPGLRISDISHCVQKSVEAAGYNVVREFAGHGIGKHMHEDPSIPNFGLPGKGAIIVKGMTFAIEPMITKGLVASVIDEDGWTARTSDGGLAAHFENTVLIVDDGCEILTC
jgi:methionyl aminopeptidase